MIRTIEEMQKLRKVFQDELAGLPEKSVFGDSNDEERQLLIARIAVLISMFEGSKVVQERILELIDDEELKMWLQCDNHSSIIADYPID